MRLRLEQVSVTRRARSLLDRVSVDVAPGELLALLGPNGAGKTTLLRVALGLTQPEPGRVLLGEAELQSLAPRERAARIAWLPQHSSTMADDLTAVDVVASARYRFGESFLQSEREARKALERVGVAAAADRPISTLSGGERQRVSLAGLLAQDTPVLLVDEPANHLDPAQQIDVYKLLGELWREGRSVVCVTHDVNLLRHLGDAARVRVAGFDRGKLAFETRFAAPDLPERLSALFGLHMHELMLDSVRVLVPEPGRGGGAP
ncbi:MAG TPA: ABC transporter ATP-binding protein [Polyangiaceae bacterium]|nr:ABC transporter ATP-binding protein [Polyangiaceae bacterium]